MWDKYLDSMYGLESKISKDEWFEKMKRLAPWVLKPETMRIFAGDLIQGL